MHLEPLDPAEGDPLERLGHPVGRQVLDQPGIEGRMADDDPDVAGVALVTGPAVGLLPALWIGALKAAVGAAVFVSTMAALWAGAGRPDGLETRAWGFGMGLVRRVFG